MWQTYSSDPLCLNPSTRSIFNNCERNTISSNIVSYGSCWIDSIWSSLRLTCSFLRPPCFIPIYIVKSWEKPLVFFVRFVWLYIFLFIYQTKTLLLHFFTISLGFRYICGGKPKKKKNNKIKYTHATDHNLMQPRRHVGARIGSCHHSIF